jgi:hypothetical protein
MDDETTHEPLAAEPISAPARLRAYEDDTFGKDAVRLRGMVERGYGSKFKEMTDGQARHYAALERMVATEQALVDAEAALLAAKASHDAAVEQVSATEAGAHAGE